MLKRLGTTTVIMVLLAALVACAKTPEQEGKAALDHMISLLEKGKGREMVETYMDPDLQKSLKASGKFDLVIEKFEARKAKKLVSRLKEIVASKPEVAKDGGQLVYRYGNGRRVRLKKIDGRWYIMNN